MIDPETINPHDFCYQCSKHGPDCLFIKLSIKYFNDEPHFPNKEYLISSRIQINMLFKAKYERKIKRGDRNIHKAMSIFVDIHQKNKKFTVIFQPKNACKLGFADNLWLPFLDQPESDIVVFANN